MIVLMMSVFGYVWCVCMFEGSLAKARVCMCCVYV
jgi:hypothetical protein